MYIENPKTEGSGILCAIPQSDGLCPRSCSDCFFMSGLSYLEPHAENLPNMPDPEIAKNFVVRVNDGLDSATLSYTERDQIVRKYPDHFYNTSILMHLNKYGPFVLTINPDHMTYTDFIKLKAPPENLMFVRFRANMWNQEILRDAVAYYTAQNVHIVITFMAYFNDADAVKTINEEYTQYYTFRKRTLNSYWTINRLGWYVIWHASQHYRNPFVSTCGRDAEHHKCSDCGVCLREYWKTKARMAGI